MHYAQGVIKQAGMVTRVATAHKSDEQPTAQSQYLSKDLYSLQRQF